jgi:hypothetical protein
MILHNNYIVSEAAKSNRFLKSGLVFWNATLAQCSTSPAFLQVRWFISEQRVDSIEQ